MPSSSAISGAGGKSTFLWRDDKPFVHESVIGTRFTGRLAGRTAVGDYPAIVPEIEGCAWITGEHTFVIDPRDPLKEGFRS